MITTGCFSDIPFLVTARVITGLDFVPTGCLESRSNIQCVPNDFQVWGMVGCMRLEFLWRLGSWFKSSVALIPVNIQTYLHRLARKKVKMAYNFVAKEPCKTWRLAVVIIILFQRWKKLLVATSLKDDRKVRAVELRWLTTQDTNVYKQRTETLLPRYDICISCSGNCVEKQWDSSAVSLNIERPSWCINHKYMFI
jgi:hypothetical protein